MTRRIVRFRDEPGDPKAHLVWKCWNGKAHVWQDGDEVINCPYGVPGDRLWVRETWAPDWEHGRAFYRADADDDGTVPYLVNGDGGFGGGVGSFRPDRWRPSIHMTRAASRIALEVVSVRVERLQDITEGDARAEGVVRWEAGDAIEADHIQPGAEHRLSFARLWNAINGKRAPWSANPWVWVVEFKRAEG